MYFYKHIEPQLLAGVYALWKSPVLLFSIFAGHRATSLGDPFKIQDRTALNNFMHDIGWYPIMECKCYCLRQMFMLTKFSDGACTEEWNKMYAIGEKQRSWSMSLCLQFLLCLYYGSTELFPVSTGQEQRNHWCSFNP